jgi:hypothetical protein
MHNYSRFSYKSLIYTLVMIFILLGCTNAPISAEKTTESVTITQSEQNPLSETQHPGVIHFPEVISKEWVKSVDQLCLQVNQSYTGVSDLNEPIAEEIKDILDRIGVETTIGENEDCMAKLHIILEMTPVGEDVIGAGTCYFDASANGEAVLSMSGENDLKLTLSRNVSTGGGGFSIVYSCPSKADANYEAAWGYALAPMFAEWWGVPALVSALRSSNYSLGTASGYRLSEIGADASGALPVLIDMLNDGDPNVRESAARTLGEFGPSASSSVPSLIRLVNDSDYGVKYEVVTALGSIGDPEGVPVLLDLLHADDNYLRQIVIEALGKMKENAAPAVPELMKAVKDGDYSIARAAVEALTEIGPKAKEAIPTLIELLEDGDQSLDWNAQTALESITGQKLGRDATAWRNWWESNK